MAFSEEDLTKRIPWKDRFNENATMQTDEKKRYERTGLHDS